MPKALALVLLCACGSGQTDPAGTYTLALTPVPLFIPHTLVFTAPDTVTIDTYTASMVFLDESTTPPTLTFEIHETFPGDGGHIDETWDLSIDAEGGTGFATMNGLQCQVVATKQ